MKNFLSFPNFLKKQNLFFKTVNMSLCFFVFFRRILIFSTRFFFCSLSVLYWWYLEDELLNIFIYLKKYTKKLTINNYLLKDLKILQDFMSYLKVLIIFGIISIIGTIVTIDIIVRVGFLAIFLSPSKRKKYIPILKTDTIKNYSNKRINQKCVLRRKQTK